MVTLTWSPPHIAKRKGCHLPNSPASGRLQAGQARRESQNVAQACWHPSLDLGRLRAGGCSALLLGQLPHAATPSIHSRHGCQTDHVPHTPVHCWSWGSQAATWRITCPSPACTLRGPLLAWGPAPLDQPLAAYSPAIAPALAAIAEPPLGQLGA